MSKQSARATGAAIMLFVGGVAATVYTFMMFILMEMDVRNWGIFPRTLVATATLAALIVATTAAAIEEENDQ